MAAPVLPERAVEALTAVHLPQVAAIERLVFPEPLDLDAVTRLWAAERTHYLGVLEDGRLLAYFAFEVAGPTAHVISNATHPEARRRGLALAVLGAGAAAAARLGARWLLGEVRRSNDAQLAVLGRLGWRSIGLVPRFFGNGEDAYVVWRPL